MVVYISRDDSYALEHHGVKGMKWGVRRYQNKDGSLTPKGKLRYKDSDAVKKMINKRTKLIEKEGVSPQSNRLGDKIQEQRNYEKSQLYSKTKRQLKLEEQYKQKGYNDKEAAAAAYRRARTERALAIAGGVAVTAAAVGLARHIYKNNVDQIIKSGTEWKRVTPNEKAELHDAFYAARKNKDTERYVGLYAGGQRGGAAGFAKMYQMSIKNTEDLKVASPAHAKKTLQELNKNNAARLELVDLMKDIDSKAAANIQRGKIGKREYEQFNRALVYHDHPSVKKFYKALSDAGYDAIGDVNDRKYSGYNAQSATIIFNKTKAAVVKSRELGQEEMKNALNKHRGMIIREQLTKALAKKGAKMAALTVGGVGIAQVSKSASENAIVEDYRKEHPNTTLSRTDILDNYYK